ncbi:hypothetical protein [Fodinicola feengrottensis]|uniref:hypothetical protein n=1 Tax=Fodinicola feengrottensis TaxID=435914 RepID=UPI0013D4F3ED|nr:hypothetical protein [Fodinicola feengrottensis]
MTSAVPPYVMSVGCVFLAGLNAYQAITGRRLSKAPSGRDQQTMRRQSSIAAVVLGLVAVVGFAVAAVMGS